MIIDKLENLLKEVFNECGYNVNEVRVIKSNRPDLCDYQCDDVFKLAKEYHKNPIEIGEAIVEKINTVENFDEYFTKVEFVRPGFINMTVSDTFINTFIKMMGSDIKKIVNIPDKKETFVLDFGGANVAKPLHVGHMRTILVGESVARIIRFFGHKTITDVHLGDYGLQIGQVIYGVLRDNIDINDIDIKYLDKIYPEMSKLCKEDESVKEECATITKKLQDGDELYTKYWKKILEVSVKDIKKIYDYLGAHFNYWYGESDSYKYLDELESILRDKNLLTESEGALVVNVSKDDDKKEVPPLLFKKSNGAFLYASTDLATILQRKKDFNPDHILYVVDLRQGLHFEQVFRTCDLSGIMPYDKLEHLAYGTVNGDDGKPYKTRNGDNPKLEGLFDSAKEIFISKKESNKDMSSEDVDKIINSILKFADLQNSREKDYIFDLNKFSEVSGKTGPYILYTYLRINKILKDEGSSPAFSNKIYNKADRDLRIKMLDYVDMVKLAFDERKPHYVAEYVYNLCTLCNVFYQTNHISTLDDMQNKYDWLFVLEIANNITKEMLYLLGIDIPSVM